MDYLKRYRQRLSLVVGEANRFPVGADQPAGKTAPSANQLPGLDARLAAGKPTKIREPGERPVEAWGTYLKKVGARDRVLDIEERRKRPADQRAVIGCDPTVIEARRLLRLATLDHDLQGWRPLAPGKPNPDHGEPHRFERGRNQLLNASGLDHEPAEQPIKKWALAHCFTPSKGRLSVVVVSINNRPELQGFKPLPVEVLVAH